MPQSAKERSHLFGIVQKRRHCHQSFEFEVREFTDLFTERQNFVRRNAGFRVFPAEIDFQKDRQPFAKFAGNPIKARREFETVYGLNDREKFDSTAGFVRLQMADQMPGDVVSGGEVFQFRDFRRSFLDAIFAQHANAGFNGLANERRRNSLADGNQRHFGKIAACALARSRDSLIDGFEAFPQFVFLGLGYFFSPGFGSV